MTLYDTVGYSDALDLGDTAGREWLDEFRKDLSSVIHALDHWKSYAIETMYAAMDFNGECGHSFSVPRDFEVLTDIVALWCDAELHIDPTTLTEVRRRFLAFTTKNTFGRTWTHGRLERRVPMTDAELEQMLDRALDCYNRVFHATLARYSTEQQETVIRNMQAREWSLPATMKTWTRRLKNSERTLRKWRQGGTLQMEKVNGQRGLWRVRLNDPRYVEWDRTRESLQE